MIPHYPKLLKSEPPLIYLIIQDIIALAVLAAFSGKIPNYGVLVNHWPRHLMPWESARSRRLAHIRIIGGRFDHWLRINDDTSFFIDFPFYGVIN